MSQELELLKRRLEREIKARKQAETTLEVKARDLYHANESLQQLNSELETQISLRSTALKTSEARYRVLVENASDLIFNISLEGRFTLINKLGIAALGYSEEEVIGSLFTDFIAPDYINQVTAHYQQVLTEGIEEDYYEFPIHQKDGEILWVSQNLNKVITADGKKYYSSITRNINKRKQTEFELEKATKALAESEVTYQSILETMNTSLKKPLNTLLSELKQLEQTPMNSKQLHSLNVLKSSAENVHDLMDKLVRQLL